MCNHCRQTMHRGRRSIIGAFLHRPRNNHALTSSFIKTILIVLSRFEADIPATLSWSTFEDILLQFSDVPNVIIDVHGAKSAFKWIMEAVQHDRTLTKADSVQLRYGSTDGSPDVTQRRTTFWLHRRNLS